jgi:hypothetical protein
MTLKQKIHHHCLQTVNGNIALLQQVLAELKESGANETKSTAGDKHETALAMLQIEQENKRAQLNAALAQKTVLEKINPAATALIVVPGSLITTSRGLLFISIALGKVVVDHAMITVLSPQSPLGQKLMGQQTGAVVEMNNVVYEIAGIA